MKQHSSSGSTRRTVTPRFVVAGLATILFLAPLPARAQSCCEGLLSPSEERLAVWEGDATRWRLQIHYAYEQLDGFQAGDTRVSLSDAKARYRMLPTKTTLQRVDLALGYVFDEAFSLSVDVPFVRKEMDMLMAHTMMGMTDWMSHEMDPVEGLGDTTVLGRWRFFRRGVPELGQQSLTLGLGLQTPTGSYREKNSSGHLIHAAMQPGTGAWDPLASLTYHHVHGAWESDVSVSYLATTANPNGYEFGDALTVSAEAAYTPWEYVKVHAGPTFRHVEKARDRDGKYTNLESLEDDPANTGGDRLYLSPGLSVVLPRETSCDLTVHVPVWSRVNGIQQRSGTSLSLTFALRF